MSAYRPGVPGNSLTLVDVLRGRAQAQPHQRACTFLAHSDTEELHLTYAELDTRARAIASVLQQKVTPAERALLLYPPGLEFVTAFIACLYAGIIAVPAYPPRLGHQDRTLPRLRGIIREAQPSIALTTTSIASSIVQVSEQIPEFPRMHMLVTDAVSDGSANTWLEPVLDSSTVAFLQFSSGSTGTPRGVILTHRNLLENLALIRRSFEISTDSHVVSWLPPFHDMGLIGGMLEPLYAGCPVTLLSPVSFLQRPFRWLQAISEKRGTISGGPNFAYDMCIRRVGDEQRATLDLSSWSLAFNGAEPVRHETLERFAAAFKSCGFRREAFYPCYGLAEATLFVSGGWKADPPVTRAVDEQALAHNQVVPAADEQEHRRVLVSSGKVWPAQQVVIVDPDTLTPCAPDQVGEIWVAGASVAQGYWGQPAGTATTFQARLADTNAGPFLRTGDLGVLYEQDLFVTGRRKDMIIIRGQNYYPQDIELTAEQSHSAIRPGCSAAFSVDVAGQEQLVVVAEIEPRYQPAPDREPAAAEPGSPARRKHLDAQSVIKAIRQEISEQHELHVHKVVLLEAGTIPKTSSGKLQRYACRASFLEGSLSAWSASAA